MAATDAHDDGLYQLVFRGQIVAGQDLAEVRRRFAALYRRDEEAIGRLFSGQPVILHRRLDRERAEATLATLRSIGVSVELVSEPRPEVSASNRPERPSRPVAAEPTPGKTTQSRPPIVLIAAVGCVLIAVLALAVGRRLQSSELEIAAPTATAAPSPVVPTRAAKPLRTELHVTEEMMKSLAPKSQPLSGFASQILDQKVESRVREEVDAIAQGMVDEAMDRAREGCTTCTVESCVPQGYRVGRRSADEIIFYVGFACRGSDSISGRPMQGAVFIPKNLVPSGNGWVAGSSWVSQPYPVAEHSEWLFVGK